MKKNIIALAVASAIAAPVAMADAPTVYGQINQAFQVSKEVKNQGTKSKKDSGMFLKSYASRLGVKGSEDLGNGLKAVYGIEFGVGMVDGSTISNRNQFAGIAGGFGTVIIGRHDTPFKMAQGYDAFNDKEFDNNWSKLGVTKNSGELRTNNALAYVSPSFSGVKVIAAFVPKETGGDTSKESSITDVISAAVTYGSKKKGLYLSGAMNSFSKAFNGSSTSTGEAATEMRLVAQYAVAGLTANVTYSDFSGKAIKDTSQEGSEIAINAAYKMGAFTPRLKYSMVDRKAKNFNGTEKDSAGNVIAASTAMKDGTGMGVGVDYALAKSTKVYADYMSLSNIQGLKKTDTSVVNVGFQVKF
ncbi:porin [Hydrogenovibrio sp. JE_KL2]|uniref:porin n=1 Tax=Hydrogenovibrio sp. JE_KL2 TaxID=2651188 RepID=UPI001C12CD27|nr:porin [Hydrogenovibrio sp. JE_KL2]